MAVFGVRSVRGVRTMWLPCSPFAFKTSKERYVHY